MTDDRLTQIPTNWTTIRPAPTPPGPSRKAMMSLSGGIMTQSTRYIHLKVRDRHLADEVLPGVLDQAAHRQTRRRRQGQRAVSRLPAHGPASSDHRSFSHPQAPAASSRRPARFLHTRRGLRPRLAGVPSSSASGPARDLRRSRLPRIAMRVFCNCDVITPKPRSRRSPSGSAKQPARSMTPEAFRKNLQRARAKFIELLILELRETIHPASNEVVEAEIYDLGLGYLYRRYTTLADR